MQQNVDVDVEKKKEVRTVLGKRVEIWWEDDSCWYAGRVINERERAYDDGGSGRYDNHT